jgi:hypothetical protein
MMRKDYTNGTLPQKLKEEQTHWAWKLVGMALAMTLLSWVVVWIAVGLTT